MKGSILSGRLRGVSAFLSVMVMASGLFVAPASAARKPDLVVSSLSAPAVIAGERFNAVAKVKNAGAAKAGKSVVRFYMSTDPKKSAGDTRLGSGRAVSSLAPRATARVVAPLTMTGDPGPYYLIACADAGRKVGESNERNNCRSTRIELDAAPTSIDLIDEAVASGEITQEQALTYKVFVVFGDQRLPDRFEAESNEIGEGQEFLVDAAGAFDSLSEDAQATLFPFFLPPFLEGSWYEGAGAAARASRAANASVDYDALCAGFAPQVRSADWSSLATDNGKARIWWETSKAGTAGLAQSYADEIDRVWPKFDEAFAEPPADGGGSIGPAVCRGPDAAIDIVIADIPDDPNFGAFGGKAVPFPNEFCPESGFGHVGGPSYLVVNSRYPSASTVIHELAHAAQFAFTPWETHCEAKYAWLMESTAVWFEDYADSEANTEHHLAAHFLKHPDWPVTTYSWGNYFHYGAYLFPKFLTTTGSTVSLIKGMWEGTIDSSMIDAVDNALKDAGRGGFEGVFHDFAVANWNTDPFDHYKETDSLGTSVKEFLGEGPEVSLSLDGKSKNEARATSATAGLSASYHRVSVDDSEIEKIEFEPTLSSGAKIKVQALVKIDGVWKEEPRDWSSKQTLCRLNDAEKLDEVVLIVSNAGPPVDAASVDMKFTVSDSCGGLEGTLDYKKTYEQQDDDFSHTESWTGKLDVAFKRQDGAWVDDGSHVTLQGTGTSDGTFTIGGLSCTSHTEFDYQINHDEAPTFFLTGGKWGLRFQVEGTETSTTTFTGDCEGTETDTQTVFFVAECNGGVESTDPQTGRLTIDFGPEIDAEHTQSEFGTSRETHNCTGALTSSPATGGG